MTYYYYNNFWLGGDGDLGNPANYYDGDPSINPPHFDYNWPYYGITPPTSGTLSYDCVNNNMTFSSPSCTFGGNVVNGGTISAGTFSWNVVNHAIGIINGGNFNTAINYPGCYIAGGIFNGYCSTISGSYITGGTFLAQTRVETVATGAIVSAYPATQFTDDVSGSESSSSGSSKSSDSSSSKSESSSSSSSDSSSSKSSQSSPSSESSSSKSSQSSLSSESSSSKSSQSSLSSESSSSKSSQSSLSSESSSSVSSYSSGSSSSNSSSSMSSESSLSLSSNSSSSSTEIRSSSLSSSSSSLKLVVLNPLDTYSLSVSDTRHIPIEFTGSDGTYATVIFNGLYNYRVANVSGSFVWDFGGSGEHTFTTIGETIIQNSGDRSYKITWDGTGSLFFTIWFYADADDRTIPFIFEVENTNPIWTMVSYGEYIFAGTGTNGLLLRSKDRFFWEKVYSVDDVNIKSLYVQGDTLYIGTSPHGKIYTLDLKTNTLSLSQDMNGEVYGFSFYQNKIYAAAGNPTQICVYNTVTSMWDYIYQLPARIVNKMLIFDGKMYVFMDCANFISFDGQYWKLESNGADNISSVRDIQVDPFVSDSIVTRSNVKSVMYPSKLSDDVVYGLYPLNYSNGIKSADVDGVTLIVGSSDYSRVYNYFDSEFHEVFKTQSHEEVNYLLNLGIGVNLASIGSKVYLLYCSNAFPTGATSVIQPSGSETTTTTTDGTEPAASVITVVSPSGGETFELSQTLNIRWTSTKGINDVVKIDLYKDGAYNVSINAAAPNSGEYEWIIPSSVPIGLGFTISVTWLTAGENTASDTGVSGEFSIIYPQQTGLPTTTTTTTPIDPSTPNIANVSSVAILDLGEEYVTCMLKDEANGAILFSTSDGRIIGCREAVANAYLTGNRNVYAEVIDGFGNTSETSYLSLLYSLCNKISEVNESKEVEKWKFQYDAMAVPNDRMNGVFVSPVIYVKNDLVSWEKLMWSENKPDDTDIVICVRASDDVNAIKLLPWDNCFTSRESDVAYGTSGLIVRDLSDFHIAGK